MWVQEAKQYLTKRDEIIENAQKCQKEASESFLRFLYSRRFLYSSLCEYGLAPFAINHSLSRLIDWCHSHHIFIHPSLRVVYEPSEYRDLAFLVSHDVPRHTPLIAIPEELVIGFNNSVEGDRNALYDPQREHEFNRLSHGAEEDDICSFFFMTLGNIVADLTTARCSALTDPRHEFASSLSKIRTLENAPYMPESVIFRGKSRTLSVNKAPTQDSNDNESSERGTEEDIVMEECTLADALLQMIRNYISAGPLSCKLERTELMWSVSVCLSHSTPLLIGQRRGIGIIPLVHLFPHGGRNTNAVVIARPPGLASGDSSECQAVQMARYFSERTRDTGLSVDFVGPVQRYYREEKREAGVLGIELHALLTHKTAGYVFVATSRDLVAGEYVQLQAMAPVCDREEESEHMWRLSCGTAPTSYYPSSYIRMLSEEVLRSSLA